MKFVRAQWVSAAANGNCHHCT